MTDVGEEVQSRWVRAASIESLPENKGVQCLLQGHDIALIRQGSKVYAINNLCPHQHIPILSEASIEGTVLTCPMHGWRFDFVTGDCVHASGRLRTYPVQLRDGTVYIQLPDESDDAVW